MQELYNNVTVERSLSPANRTSTTQGQIHDMQGYESILFAIASGTVTGTSITPLIEEGDQANLSDAAAVPDSRLLPSGTGQEAAAQFLGTDDDEVHKIGAWSSKRYIRLTLTMVSITVGNTEATALKFRKARTPAA